MPDAGPYVIMHDVTPKKKTVFEQPSNSRQVRCECRIKKQWEISILVSCARSSMNYEAIFDALIKLICIQNLPYI